MPTGTLTQKTARQSHSESAPPMTKPRNDPADRGDLVDPEGETAALRRERVGDERRRVGQDHRAAEALNERIAMI